jgi:XTP/dITP diphosphohydrolase
MPPDAGDPPRPSATPILIASGNPGKVAEFRGLLRAAGVDCRTPSDIGLELEVAETGETLLENAVIKARAFAAASGLPSLADDSGLEVDALGGAPGVRSARWVPGSDDARVKALLEALAGLAPERRGARFRAVLALAWPDGRLLTAEGRVQGRIGQRVQGTGGFGYDPVFLVEDGGLDGRWTMAELDPALKAALSHRARALRALLDALRP